MLGTQAKDEHDDDSAAADAGSHHSSDITTQLSYSDVVHKGEEGAEG